MPPPFKNLPYATACKAYLSNPNSTLKLEVARGPIGLLVFKFFLIYWSVGNGFFDSIFELSFLRSMLPISMTQQRKHW